MVMTKLLGYWARRGQDPILAKSAKTGPRFKLHRVSPLSQKRGHIQICLLKIRNHGIAHAIESDDFRGRRAYACARGRPGRLLRRFHNHGWRGRFGIEIVRARAYYKPG